MPKTFIQADQIHDLADGDVGVMLNAALKTCFDDINDRPKDPTARKIVLAIEIKRGTDGDVNIATSVNTTLPKQVSRVTNAELDKRAGGFVYQSTSPERVDQPTLDDHLPKGDR